jgi:hypothetical protein
VELVDISDVSVQLFITGVIFIMMIGSFLSLGVLKLFQLKKRQGIIYLVLAVVSLISLILIVNTWFS